MRSHGMPAARGLFLAVLLLAISPLAVASEILGRKPDYLPHVVGSIPNEEAIAQRIWAPGLDQGYVPQGLAVAGTHLFVTGYRGDDKSPGASCRVFRIDARTGKETGSFDLPPECGHSGGVVDIGQGLIVVADTQYLWRIDAEKAFAGGRAQAALRGTVKLGGELRGSFLSFDGLDLWIGTYTVRKDADKAKIHRLKVAVFDEFDGRSIDEAQVQETLPAPPLGQGMAFQGKDAIWIASSSSMIGWLHRLDRASGRVLARYDTVIGIEGIAFDDTGRLWAVSEAGAKKYLLWKTHFPLVFAIDVSKLQ